MTRADGLLGLASRAGQITLGADLALREIKGGRAAAVLLDAGASDGTRKKNPGRLRLSRRSGVYTANGYPFPRLREGRPHGRRPEKGQAVRQDSGIA